MANLDLDTTTIPELAEFARTISPASREFKSISAEIVGELDSSDVDRLKQHRGSAPVEISNLKARHHTLARLIAQGNSQTDAALAVGYDIARVSNLMQSQAFRDLVRFYAKREDENNQALMAKMSNVSVDAIDELQHRLEEEPEAFTSNELLEIVKVTADRTGHGPSSSTKVDINVGLASRLEAARARVAAARQLEAPPIIDGSIIDEDDV